MKDSRVAGTQACNCKRDRFDSRSRQRAALSSATQYAVPQEIDGKCRNTPYIF